MEKVLRRENFFSHSLSFLPFGGFVSLCRWPNDARNFQWPQLVCSWRCCKEVKKGPEETKPLPDNGRTDKTDCAKNGNWGKLWTCKQNKFGAKAPLRVSCIPTQTVYLYRLVFGLSLLSRYLRSKKKLNRFIGADKRQPLWTDVPLPSPLLLHCANSRKQTREKIFIPKTFLFHLFTISSKNNVWFFAAFFLWTEKICNSDFIEIFLLLASKSFLCLNPSIFFSKNEKTGSKIDWRLDD